MEVASLAIGIIPIVIECSKLAFSIQRICENVGGGFRAKKDQLCVEIKNLRRKMIEIKDAKPEAGTTLEEDIEKLRSNLAQLEVDLQPLVSKPWVKRIFYYEKIEKGLDDALKLVASCETSFQISCSCYLVKIGESTRSDIRDVSRLAMNAENNTNLILEELLRSRRLRSKQGIIVKVRSLGNPDARELSYEVGPTDTVRCITKRMCDENHDVNNIHFFSWSLHRHRLTESGQDWRYRKANISLSTIKNECGKKDSQDVDWCLEYIRSPEAFTLFLVHGIQKETGLLIPYPVNSILERIQSAYISYCDMKIEKCQKLENGDEFDWNDLQSLRKIMPYTCSLCIRLADSVRAATA